MSIVAPVREQGKSASATAGSDKFSDDRFSGSSSGSDSDSDWYSDTYSESGDSGSSDSESDSDSDSDSVCSMASNRSIANSLDGISTEEAATEVIENHTL